MSNPRVFNKPGQLIPITTWMGLDSPDEWATLEEAIKLTKLPCISHVSLMPDGHIGKGCCIGSVIGSKTAILPSAVGVDIGCGMAEPIAGYLLDAGFHIVGVDSSPAMIDMCRARFPRSEWIVADMRHLELSRRFDALLAWDSFIHLHMDDQRAMFPRFAAHAAPGAPLMFTSGPSEGEAIGSYRGEPLDHGSLDPAEYERLLVANGFLVDAHVADDPECGGHTVWLSRYAGTSQPGAS